MCSRARLDRYRTAPEQDQIEFAPALVRYGDFEHPSAHAHILELFARIELSTHLVRRDSTGPPPYAPPPRACSTLAESSET